MATATKIRLTEEEFLSCPDWDGYELVDGEPVEVPMGGKAAWLGGEAFHHIRTFLEHNAIGLVFPQDTAFKAWPSRPNHLRKPDTMVFLNGRFAGDEAPEGTIEIAPDLAVEVVSPGDNARDLEEKVAEYLEAGVRLIWVIYPETRSAHVFRLNGGALRLEADDALSGEDILPGFTLPLATLFPAALPTAEVEGPVNAASP